MAAKRTKALAKAKPKTLSLSEATSAVAEYAYQGNKSVLADGGLPWIRTDQTLNFNMGDEQLGDTIEVFVLDFAYTNQWFDADYDPGNPRNPSCAAIARDPDLLVPVEGDDKQSEQCSTCWADVFGTANVGKGKACKNSIKALIVPANEVLDGKDNPTAMFLGIPPTAMKPFRDCAKTVDRHELPLSAVRIRVQCVPSGGARSLTFTPIDAIDSEVHGQLDKLGESLEGDLMRAPRTGNEEPAPKSKPKVRPQTRGRPAKKAPGRRKRT
jgi:hypothetical protein